MRKPWILLFGCSLLRTVCSGCRGVGFRRIDYHLATPAVAALARREHIYLAQRFSDHAPLIIDYDFDL